MKKNKISLNIVSSFNHANFVALLRNSDHFDFEVNEVDFNQVFQSLTDPKSKLWTRITLFQGAPLSDELILPEADDWFAPVFACERSL